MEILVTNEPQNLEASGGKKKKRQSTVAVTLCPKWCCKVTTWVVDTMVFVSLRRVANTKIGICSQVLCTT